MKTTIETLELILFFGIPLFIISIAIFTIIQLL